LVVLVGRSEEGKEAAGRLSGNLPSGYVKIAIENGDL